MGWATKTNCDTPRPTLGNPASLLPYVYRPSALPVQNTAAFSNNAPDPSPAPVAVHTAAADLADHLPSASDLATQPVATTTRDSSVASPSLSPVETSLIKPDDALSNVASAHVASPETKMIPFVVNEIISGIIPPSTDHAEFPFALRAEERT